MGLVPAGKGGVNYMIEMPNRGKKSIGIDLTTEGGKEVLYKLVETADVFVTNYLPEVRKKLGLDVDDIRKINPNVIYVRGSAYGPNGPGADKPGYDGVSVLVARRRRSPADALVPECPSRSSLRVRRSVTSWAA